MINNPYQTYANTQATTATPGELTLMLYNGAIRFLKQAAAAMEQKNIQDTNKFLLKGQDIIKELMSTLNLDYSVAKDLLALYDFMNRQLTEANLHKENPQPVREVIELLEDLRNTWNEMLKLSKAPAAGMNS